MYFHFILTVISISRIDKSTNSSYATSPLKDDETASNTNTAPSSVANENTLLLESRKSFEELPADDEEEQITFADIPMPGLWEEDKPGRNTDRVIILLFVLLASMIVVSTY